MTAKEKWELLLRQRAARVSCSPARVTVAKVGESAVLHPDAPRRFSREEAVFELTGTRVWHFVRPA